MSVNSSEIVCLDYTVLLILKSIDSSFWEGFAAWIEVEMGFIT